MKYLISLALIGLSANAATIYPGPGNNPVLSYKTSLLPDRATIFVDATNGVDTAIGWNIANPVKTVTNAITKITNGAAIFLMPGLFNCYTSNVIMPVNTWLWGSGTNASIVYGYADCSNVRGPQILPRDNCWVSNLQVRCDTNSLETAVTNAGHSGTWAGIGFTQDSKTPFKTTSATNWSVTHVLVRDGYFDCVHINQNLPWSLYCNDVTCDAVQGFNLLSQNGTHQSSRAVLENCTVLIHDDCPANIFNNGGFWNPGFLNTDTYIEIINCVGLVKTNGNGSLAQPNVDLGYAGAAPQMFVFNTVNSPSNSPAMFVSGGIFKNLVTSDPSDFMKQYSAWGRCNYNGTNFFKASRGFVKAARPSGAGVTTNTMIYQMDNTPGTRVWNGVHWVQYTETNDD